MGREHDEMMAKTMAGLSDEAAADVATGNYESWIKEVVVLHDSQAFSRYFDESVA